jgi:NAD(P)H-flavin reductase
VTNALTNCEEGDIIGFRGPYGNSFPLVDWFGKNLLFISGGIALPPLRGLIWNAIDLRDKFREITIIYGAKNANDLVYKSELELWRNLPNVRLYLTVDPGGEPENWKDKIGFVPTIVKEISPSSTNTIALVCGPPIMIKLTLPVLSEIGFTNNTIYTTLENRMKCGIGKCGHCMCGNIYVCKDGPVFSYEQVIALPQEY